MTSNCKYNIVVDHCQSSGNAQLQELNIPKLECSSCSSGSYSVTKAVQKAISLYPKMNAENKKRVQMWLISLGFHDEASALFGKLSKPMVSIDFNCPVTSTDLVVECNIKACKYHINHPWSLNCLLAYTQQQGIDTLSPEEISYIYNLSSDVVFNSLRSGIYALRSNAIVSAYDQDNVAANKFTFFKTTEVCCVCESLIDDNIPSNLLLPQLGLAYCSKECKTKKPARLIELEHEYGLDIATILDWTFKKFQSLNISEQSLSLPRWLSYHACQTFLGKKPEDFFTSLKYIKNHRRSMLIRRTWHAPLWVDQLLTNIRPVERTVYKEHGKSTIDMRPIYSSLKYVLNNL